MRSLLCELLPMRSRLQSLRASQNRVAKLHKALKLCPFAPLRDNKRACESCVIYDTLVLGFGY